MNLPVCSNPRIILNPAVVDFILKYRTYFIKGSFCQWRGKGKFSNIDRLKWCIGVRKNNISLDDLDSSYAIDFRSGECIPLYIAVPCGKCPNCEMTKRWTHVFKCQLENQCYRSYPWFVTLTYKTENLPYADGFSPDSCLYPKTPTLSVRDVQLFLKRFRINLKRMYDGKYNFPIRYVACGEYGKKGRPHYHLIIWGVDTFSPQDYSCVSKILQSSWSLGFITLRLVNNSDDKCFRYTTKYLLKSPEDSHMVHFKQRLPFLNSSKGKLGGIGKRFLLQNQDYMYKFLDDKLKYFNRFTGKPEKIHFNGWSLNVLFPSFCRLVPSDVRRAVLDWSYYRYIYRSRSLNRVIDVFSKYCFIPDWSDGVSLTPKFSLDECKKIVGSWCNKVAPLSTVDLDRFLCNCKNKSYLREKFLMILDSHQDVVDIKAREFKAIQERNRMLSLEIVV